MERLEEMVQLRRQFDDDETMPLRPGVALALHVVTRATALGAAAGLLGGLVRGIAKSSLTAVASTAAFGTLGGSLVGAGMLSSKVLTKPDSFDADGVRDRALRLANNPAQTRFDDRSRLVVPGLAATAAVTPLRVSLPTRLLFGIGLGFEVCFVLMVMEMREQKAKLGEQQLRTME
ncbi:Hypothetical Protein FCC1311_094302 [Hondaea fermentalgiana]|uniref:Uncharacterized protein n=1 Tax=Hondaea fermentalgiana TaxID=2315210 RepID=A0A2R5GQP8_9STRA|nr:Hypothetical Protein FCC1311_094302 [Hondaea fermentalgiana]|eukprot:GBG33206.1 Hypothetical Protein FCC1311_094302 [Hondaea fermentalgiana]